LEFTIQADSKLIAQFDAFRKKRNLGDYSIAGSISKKEADEMVALAQKLRKDVEELDPVELPSTALTGHTARHHR